MDSEVTRLLQGIEAGNPRAAEELLPLVYEELRRLAQRKMAREKAGQTLQPTALVHEAYLNLIGDSNPKWSGTRHFFGAAAEAMRRILIHRARRKAALKRGGDLERDSFHESAIVVEASSDELLALHEALSSLEEKDPQSASLVKLRYFVGMNTKEAAQALEIPLRTAERLWAYARVWLHREIKG